MSARRSSSGRGGASLPTALMLVLLGAGCGGAREGDAGAAERTPADATYRTRAVVRELPAGPDGELVLFHEAVPELVDRKGERTGMDSMTMGFAVAEGVSLDRIAEGDKVELTFELRWAGAPTLLVTELAELPADTPLQLGRGPAEPSSDPPAPVEPSPAPLGAGGDGDRPPSSGAAS